VHCLLTFFFIFLKFDKYIFFLLSYLNSAIKKGHAPLTKEEKESTLGVRVESRRIMRRSAVPRSEIERHVRSAHRTAYHKVILRLSYAICVAVRDVRLIHIVVNKLLIFLLFSKYDLYNPPFDYAI